MKIDPLTLTLTAGYYTFPHGQVFVADEYIRTEIYSALCHLSSQFTFKAVPNAYGEDGHPYQQKRMHAWIEEQKIQDTTIKALFNQCKSKKHWLELSTLFQCPTDFAWISKLRIVKESVNTYIRPHRDDPPKFLTMILYLGGEELLDMEGTSIYEDAGPHQLMATVPCKPNRAVFIYGSDKLMHGVQAKAISGQRMTLQQFWYKTQQLPQC